MEKHFSVLLLLIAVVSANLITGDSGIRFGSNSDWNHESQFKISLTGEYSTNLLENPKITIEFDENRLSLKGGCNSQMAQYNAFSKGKFDLKKFISTKIKCENDKDHVYTSALSRSSYFIKNSNGQVILRNLKGETTLILTSLTNPPSGVQCSANQILTPSGCWESCANPSFQLKPKPIGIRDNSIWPLYREMQQFICAYTSDGRFLNQWAPYQACNNQQTKFVAFRASQHCGCDLVICPQGHDCHYGSCKNPSNQGNIDLIFRNGNRIQGKQLDCSSFSCKFGMVGIITTGGNNLWEHCTCVPQAFNISGQYSTIIKNNPHLRIKFTGDQFDISNGCNNFVGQYQAFADRSIKFISLVGTKKSCQNDFDALYTTALFKSVSFQNLGDKIIFKDQNGAITLTLSNATPVSLFGRYLTDELILEISETRFYWKNYCIPSSLYKALSDGSFSLAMRKSEFVSYGVCRASKIQKQRQKFDKSTSFIRDADGTVTFRNSTGDITLTLRHLKQDIVQVQLVGKYSTNLLDNPKITIQFTKNTLGLSGGCNNQGGEYIALSDGSFSADIFFSTRVYCRDDKDSVYTDALFRSKSFVRNADGTVTLRNSTGEITLILKPLIVTATPNLCLNRRCPQGFRCSNGNCLRS